MSTILDRIMEYKRAEVVARKEALGWAALEARARTAPTPRGFAAALKSAARPPALIAEIKRASPSKGLIRADFHPSALALAYAQGGAACLSVLTDTPSFQGADAHLEQARAAVDLPILRKDFLCDPYQVAEARALGADCVLVILAAVEDALAAELCAAARDWALDVLVEVHDGAELERAVDLGAALIGINNRSLHTFETRLETFERLAPRAPAQGLLVAESGIFTPADVQRVRAAGAQAILVGESLMRQPDVRAATEALLRPVDARMERP